MLPLGYDETVFDEGTQAHYDEEIVLALVGRLVPEKGVEDGVRVLARVNARRPARLVVAGRGPLGPPTLYSSPPSRRGRGSSSSGA